jgi:molybdopterin adenylyltransferase
MSGDLIRIGLVSVSDRASSGGYQDQGIPALKDWLAGALTSPWEVVERLIPDDQATIEKTLIELCDEGGCALVLTIGGPYMTTNEAVTRAWRPKNAIRPA